MPIIFSALHAHQIQAASHNREFPLLIDMTAPGCAPIVTLAGDHEVNQVFFDNVRVPVANLVAPNMKAGASPKPC